MNGTDSVLEVDEDLISEGEETPPEERNLVEELLEKTGRIYPNDFPLTQFLQLVDVGDEIDGVTYATVGFVPPEMPKGKEPLGEGKFTMTFRVDKNDVRLVDWLAE